MKSVESDPPAAGFRFILFPFRGGKNNNRLEIMNLFEQYNMGRVSAVTYGGCLLVS